MGPLTHLNIFPHIAGGTFSILFNGKYTFRPTCVSTTRWCYRSLFTFFQRTDKHQSAQLQVRNRQISPESHIKSANKMMTPLNQELGIEAH